MNTHDIQQLIDRYLADETTPDEERQLALALHQAAEAGEPMPDEWQAVLLMLGELTLGEALYNELMAQQSHLQPPPIAPRGGGHPCEQRASSNERPPSGGAERGLLILSPISLPTCVPSAPAASSWRPTWPSS